MPRANARALAITAADATCPRCRATRRPADSYCLDCGLHLPEVDGAVAALRRGWLRGIGWYPGDWLWLALATLVVAAGGAALAIVLNRHHTVAAATTFVAPEPRRTLPSTGAVGPNGRTEWPPGRDGWTVALLSSPSTKGTQHPFAVSRRAAHDGLPQVGVLDSSAFSSLHPGYYVVFSGVYGAPGDATTALETVRARGFGGSYVVRVTP